MVIIEETGSNRSTVSFVLASADAGAISVVGSFNDWQPSAHAFPAHDDRGLRIVTINVEPGTTLEFRYLSETAGWLDETSLPGRPNDFGTWNAVLVVPAQSSSHHPDSP